MASNIPDDPAMEDLLFDYFPKVLHKYDVEIRNHKLKRGIIATQIVNVLVNRMGPVFVQSRTYKTGASAEAVIRAYMIVTEAFGVPETLKSIEALDNKVDCAVQLAALYDVYLVVKRAVTWFLRFGATSLQVKENIKASKPGLDVLKKDIEGLIPDTVRDQMHAARAKFVEKGMPLKIAEEIAVMSLLASANDIITIADRMSSDVRTVATAYFQTGERLGLDWLRRQAGHLVPENDWQARVISGLTDDFFSQQAALTAGILRGMKKGAKGGQAKLVDEWFESHHDMIAKIVQLVEDLKRMKTVELEMLTLVSQRIGQLVHQVKT
jgi:glutamate dehydrogenase